MYTWLINTGPRIRAALPEADNQPMYIPCKGDGRGQQIHSGLVILNKNSKLGTLIPALRRQRQVGLCKFKASLVYKVSSRTARAVTQRNPIKTKKKKKDLKEF